MAQPMIAVTNEIKIEKGVPMPGNRKSKGKYPWKEMEVGDSFFVPCPGGNDSEMGVQRNLIGSGRRYFKTRTARLTEDGVRGVRIWRIA